MVKYVEWNGIKYVNTTPHSICFRDPDTGEEFTIPPCGILVNARPVEVPAGERSGVKLVRTVFEADDASLAELDAVEKSVPGAVIIGSIIAAQAYPGRVVAMTPCPGYERVAPDQKRMNPFKFTVY